VIPEGHGCEGEAMKRYAPEKLLGPLSPIERKNAPEILFAAGRIELLTHGRRVAVVGTRTPSPDGAKRAARLARFLAENGVTVVSGLALGIDTVAHRTAIEHGGATIAVLATPLDQVTPKENADLQQEIMKDHLALSQFASGYPIKRSNFPRRNRTMALVSDASVIVEASATSGTLHQGYEALRLGRPLFLLKSVFDTAGLDWPAEMLHYGARVLSEPEELLEVIPTGADDAIAALAV